LDPLERERREIERRRKRFDDRKKVILDAKKRIIGVDKAALESQIKEKEDKKKLEAQDKQLYDTMRGSHAKLLSEVERERQRARAAKEEELAFYRKQQEQMAKRKKHEDRVEALAPPVKGNTVFVDFQGEDLDKAQREVEQKRQQQQWLTQQLTALNEKSQRLRKDDLDYAEQERQINEMKKQLEEEAHAARKTLQKQTQQYNAVQLAQKKRLSEIERETTHKLNQQEIASQLGSELLNEKAAEDALRVNFKGFSAAQRQQILAEQQRQAAELADKRAREVAAEADYARMQDDMMREMVRQEKAKQERERQQRLQLRAVHLQQQKEHQQQMTYLNKHVYTNPVKPEFFDQFGQSHR